MFSIGESGFESQGSRTEKNKNKMTFSGFFLINFVYRNFYYTLEVKSVYKKLQFLFIKQQKLKQGHILLPNIHQYTSVFL